MMDEVRARLQEASEREEFNSGGDVLALLGDDIRVALAEVARLKISVALLKEDRASNAAEVERLRGALKEIARGEGRYSRDPLEHASNTIEDMQALAKRLLEGP